MLLKFSSCSDVNVIVAKAYFKQTIAVSRASSAQSSTCRKSLLLCRIGTAVRCKAVVDTSIEAFAESGTEVASGTDTDADAEAGSEVVTEVDANAENKTGGPFCFGTGSLATLILSSFGN